MKKILLMLLITTTIAFAQEYKVVFNLTSGDTQKVSKSLILNIDKLREHYQLKGDSLKVAVVISGKAYKFFLNNQKTSIDNDFKSLADSGVEFKVCSVGMKKRAIKISSLDSYVVPAFNRTAALIEYQNAGYAYIEVK